MMCSVIANNLMLGGPNLKKSCMTREVDGYIAVALLFSAMVITLAGKPIASLSVTTSTLDMSKSMMSAQQCKL